MLWEVFLLFLLMMFGSFVILATVGFLMWVLYFIQNGVDDD
jgi:hypothetical protein